MAADGENGQGETRLDRIERLLAEHLEQNQMDHANFMREHQLLLRAQVLMTDTMTQVEVKMLEIQEKLDGLIHVVDGLIQKRDTQ